MMELQVWELFTVLNSNFLVPVFLNHLQIYLLKGITVLKNEHVCIYVLGNYKLLYAVS